MGCVACGHSNRVGAVFCEGCGARLVATCASCGAELRASARFCDQCGTPTAADAASAVSAPPAGDRKVVTILFADLSGSTSLQERLDAEATARLMGRIQTVLSTAVTEHDGRVVKSTGDGLMAVFGVPQLREDDAVRAVRAGIAMQSAFEALDLADIGLRVGVNTGEVVVSPDSDDVVGDPVNVAARLEGAARLGDVLVGPETQRLVRDVIGLEAVEPLVLKGKARPVPAARVVHELRADAAAPTQFLGRDRDVTTLIAALDDAIATASTRLVTVLGWPGLGKSRLATELVRIVGQRATVVEVRFVAGGGTSFGPIAEALRHVVDPSALDLGVDTERLAATIDALVTGGSPGSTEQVFWSIRRILEGLAARAPVVVVLDDLHWAEPAMLDLVEHLAEWLHGAPVLLLALARPELRDRRPTLLDATGPSSSVLVLGGLDAEACRRLALDVLGADAAPDGIVGRALEASEGNPLFLRELLRLLVDDGILRRDDGGRWALTVEIDAIELPATIHAALAARIEQLHPDERAVLQAASVIGRHFARGAVASLLPPSFAARLDAHLSALHVRALVDPEGTWWDDERMFRFHHVLIRDAAYRRVLKEVRADQHVQYADWLSARAGGEHDEVLGFHLEQAIAYRRELGEPVDAAVVARAVHHLAVAGRRALDGDDLANAAALLGRALALAPGDADLLRDRCEALVAGGDVHEAVDAVADLAAAANDERTRALADVFDAQLTGQRSPDALRSVATRAATAAAILVAHGDDVGVAHAESVQATALAGLGQVAACEAALDRSLAAARRAGDTRRANAVLSIAPAAALWGPSPIARASGRCLDVIRVLRITSWAPHVEAHALRHQAVLEAMRDRADAARRMLGTAKQTFTDLGHRLGLLEIAMYEGLVELLDSEPAAAETPLRRAVEGFDALGARVSAARATALLARAALELDRLDEAATLADPLLAGDDLTASIGLLGVAAEVLARRGEPEEAEALARRAVALAEPTDALVDHADARLSLARVLTAAGKHDEAGRERARARELYEAKGATVGMRRAEALVSTLSTLLVEPSSGGRVVDREPPRRRIARNTAVDNVERWHTAVRRRDLEEARALLSATAVYVNHRLDAFEERGGVDQSVAGFNAVSPRLSVDQEVLAALGDRHVVVRRTWQLAAGADGGAVEVDNIAVVGVDADGLVIRVDTFDASGDLSMPLRCLIERWAEEELDGADAERARRMAATWARSEALNTGDWDRLAGMLDPDVIVVDHRQTGVTLQGVGAYLDWLRAGRDAAELYEATVNDVLVLSRDGSLTCWHAGGDVHGAAFSLPSYVVTASGPSGATRRVEIFSDDQLGDAWACFDHLVDGDQPERRPRRIVRNAAVDNVERWHAAMRRRDFAAAQATVSPDRTTVNHRVDPVEEHGRATTTVGDFEARGVTVDQEVLAALGDRHVLVRRVWRYPGDGGRGPVEMDNVTVLRVDDAGTVVRSDAFDGDDDLARPLQCLVQRWAEDEAAGEEQAAVGWDMGDAYRNADWGSVATLFTDDAVLIDHRTGGAGVRVGVQAIVDYYRTFREAADEAELLTTDVLALERGRSLIEVVVRGHRGGERFELPGLAVITLHRSGRMQRAEVFALDRFDDAWACYDGVAASGAPSPPRRRVAENLATETSRRAADAIARGDVDELRRMFRDASPLTHEPLHVAVPGANAAASLAWMGRNDGAMRVEPLATLRDHHALERVTFTFVDPSGGGRAEAVYVIVTAVTDAGVVVGQDVFDDDDICPAFECLVARWAQHELSGDERRRALQTARCFSVFDAIRDADWDGFAAVFEEDAELHDLREAATGQVQRGRAAITAWLRAFGDVAERSTSDLVDVLDLTPELSLWAIRNVGTSIGGGRFERASLLALRFGPTGRIAAARLFDPEAIDRARDWLDGGRRLTRRVAPNQATAAIERRMRARLSRDLDAFSDLLAEDYVRVAHALQTQFSRADELRFAAETWEVLGSVQWDVTASLGARHCLISMRFDWTERGHGGEAEMTRLQVCRTDASGRLQRIDSFDGDALPTALSCLVERWAEEEANPAEQGSARAILTVLASPRYLVDRDWTSYRGALHDQVVLVDHRPMSAGTFRGAEAVLRWVRAIAEPFDALESTFTDVHDLTTRHAVLQWCSEGSVAGTKVLARPLMACRFDAAGHTDLIHLFPDDRIGDAVELVRTWDETGAAPGLHLDPAVGAAVAAATQVTDAYNDGDLVRLRQAFSADARIVDHRPVGWGDLDVDAYLAGVASIRQQSPDARMLVTEWLHVDRAVVVLKLRIEGQSEGAPFESDIVSVRWCAGGRVSRIELYAIGDERRALAAASADADRPADVDRTRARRVTPNLATAAYATWAAGVRSGDPSARSAIDAPGYRRIDHELRAEIPGRRTDLVEQGYRIADATFEPLASLGDRHALCHMAVVWSDDAGEQVRFDRLAVTRVDAAGQVVQDDLFASDRLADALGTLFERWGEDELDADVVALERATTIAVGFRDPVHRCQDAVVLVDHRRGTTGAAGSVDAHGHAPSSMVTDILDLTQDAALVVDGSGALVLARFGSDGLVFMEERFGTDQVAEARHRSATSEPEPRCAVRPTLAWSAVQRYGRLARTGDMDGVADLYASTYQMHRHDQHIDLDRRRHMSSEAEYIEAGTDARVDHLVTLGERVDLHRLTLRWDQDHAGQVVDYELLVVTLVGEDGRYLSDDIFTVDQLDAALACAIERWADAELVGPARERALASRAMVWNSRAINTRDWELYRSAFEPDAILVDHRPAAVGEVRGVEAIVEWMQLIAGGELRTSIDRVLAMTPDAWMLRWHAAGVRDGGPFELPSIIAVAIGERGRIVQVHVFPDERVEDAAACFDDLRVAATRARARGAEQVGENAAVRVYRDWTQAIVDGDLERALDVAASTVASQDRRSLLQLPSDVGPDRRRDEITWLIEQQIRAVVVDPVAVRGERLALCRSYYRADAGEVEVLNLTEVDGALERFTAGIVFDPDDVEAAMAELDRRAAQLVWDFGSAAHNERDPVRFRAMFTDDAVVANHKPAGFGEVSADEFTALTVALWDLHRAKVHGEVERATPRAALLRSLTDGEDNVGGRMQIDSIVVLRLTDDGRVNRLDTWDPEQRLEAEAFYDDLSSD